MTEEQTVDKDKFDALLQKLIRSKPISNEEIAVKSKAEKPNKIVRKMDK
ncbi:MAG: hypothetical protein M3Y72_05060 [Acidobacteriota bacterium]|nr:hypothetical protein [Acidobacteriota bacterium]